MQVRIGASSDKFSRNFQLLHKNFGLHKLRLLTSFHRKNESLYIMFEYLKSARFISVDTNIFMQMFGIKNNSGLEESFCEKKKLRKACSKIKY